MNFSRHCVLCENEIKSLEKGVICKLTHKAPDFYKTCSNITLDEKFERKLQQANLELYVLLKIKNLTYWKIFITAGIGILIVLGSGIFTEALTPLRYYWVYRSVIIGIGILMFIDANFRLQRFWNRLKYLRLKKNNIDVVLNAYGIKYESFFNYNEKIHGDTCVDVTIEYKNWTKIRTTISYIIN